jgi:methionine-S-sulfoxide reductase
MFRRVGYLFALGGLVLAVAGFGMGQAPHGRDKDKDVPSMTSGATTAIFAGGCFWCMEYGFEHADGVIEAISGYAGGLEVNPTYADVSSMRTGHLEVVQVTYDPAQLSYAQLLEVFWQNINPTQANGQFADTGPQYRTAIFYGNEEERQIAEASKAALDASGKFNEPIVTDILPASTFYPAEDAHQDYYKKNPLRYKLYSTGSGRTGYLKKTWGTDH